MTTIDDIMDEDEEITDITGAYDHVDDPDVLERAKTNPALHDMLVMSRPRNWWGTGLNPKVLFEIAKDDGIPVVEVPPSHVLLDLAAAPDRNARMAVLLALKQEIVDQCKEITLDCDDPWAADACELIGKAIAAYEDGHYEAAMALAVSVSEPLAIWASTPRVQAFESRAAQEKDEEHREKISRSRYKWAAFELSDEKAGLVCGDEWNYRALIAPIPLFFTGWSPDSGLEPPKSLSRHVVAHQPTRQHFSPENALLSLMLTTSLLRYQQGWFETFRYMDWEQELQERYLDEE
jgi:hypothetical protein